MVLPSFDEQVASMDSRLLDSKSGFGVVSMIEMASGLMRPLSAVVDLSSEVGSSKVGSIGSIVGFADISEADSEGVSRGDFFVSKGVRYEIFQHPELVDFNLVRLSLAVTNEQSEQPDIRY